MIDGSVILAGDTRGNFPKTCNHHHYSENKNIYILMHLFLARCLLYSQNMFFYWQRAVLISSFLLRCLLLALSSQSLTARWNKNWSTNAFFPYKKPLMLIHISWPQYIISIWRRELGGVPNMTLGKSLQIRQRQSS